MSTRRLRIVRAAELMEEAKKKLQEAKEIYIDMGLPFSLEGIKEMETATPAKSSDRWDDSAACPEDSDYWDASSC
jgi:hypothetical protein